MRDLGRIRRLYFRDGLSLSAIARKTGYSRNTIKRWSRAPEGIEPKYRRPRREGKLAPYATYLLQALEADARRPKRDRRSALKLFGQIQALGFTGAYSRVTEFVRRWRVEGGNAPVTAYVPLRFELGEAFQFDWSEERLVIGGVWRKLLAAHIKLCASRAFVLVAYPSQGHEISCHWIICPSCGACLPSCKSGKENMQRMKEHFEAEKKERSLVLLADLRGLRKP